MESVIRRSVLQEGTAVCREIRDLEDRYKAAMLGFIKSRKCCSGAETGGPNVGRSALHAYYPLLFRTAFPAVEQARILELCRLERLYAEHLLACDRLLDQGQKFDPLSLFASHLKQIEALKGLYGIFAPGHPFWSMFRECHAQAWRAVFLERLRHRHCLRVYSLSEFECTAKGRTALFKVFALALPHLASREDLLEPMSLSLEQHHVGLLFLDDLEDWREDYAACRFSYPLTRILLENRVEDDVKAGAMLPLLDVGRLLYKTGVAREQLGLAEGCFRKAMDLAKKMDLPLWVGFNREYVLRCRAMSETVESLGRGQPADAVGRVKGQRAARGYSSTKVFLHPGLPQEHLDASRLVLQKSFEVLPDTEAMRFFLGIWPGMPGHFLLVHDDGLSIGIHLDPVCLPARSASGRPLETEVVLAYFNARRFVMRGPVLSGLEILFVAGMALRFWLDRVATPTPWEVAGMRLLEWQWCQKNEWALWESLQCGLQIREGRGGPFIPEMDPMAEASFPAPRNSFLYLSLRVFDEIVGRALDADPANLLLKWGAREIAAGLGLRIS